MGSNFSDSLFSIDTLMIFRGVIPCLVVVFIGFLVGRVDRAAHEKTLSSLIYFVFSPCLVFVGLHRHTFSKGETGVLALAAVLTVLLLVPPAIAVKRLNGVTERGYILPMLFTSSGTLLMPLSYLLYGNEGLAKAAIFHLVSSLLFNTFGTWLVAGRMQPWRFFRSPTFVAVLIAALTSQISLYAEFFRLVERGIDIVAYGAVPFLLLSFGYPFCRTDAAAIRKGLWGGFVRITAGPAAAFLVVLLLRQLGLLSVEKGYNVLDYIDMRTTEAVIILAGSIPGALSCYIANCRNSPGTAADSLAILVVSTVFGLISIPVTLLVINRFILSALA
jgi:predicted permease